MIQWRSISEKRAGSYARRDQRRTPSLTPIYRRSGYVTQNVGTASTSAICARDRLVMTSVNLLPGNESARACNNCVVYPSRQGIHYAPTWRGIERVKVPVKVKLRGQKRLITHFLLYVRHSPECTSAEHISIVIACGICCAFCRRALFFSDGINLVVMNRGERGHFVS